MKYVVIVCAVVLGFFACTKGGGNIYLKGKVYNPVTGEGVSNITIELVKDQPLKGDPFLGGDSKVVKSVTTENDGTIEIYHLASLVHNYFYKIDLNGQKLKVLGWESGFLQNQKGAKKKENDYDNLQVVRFANVNWYVENINCQSQDDSLRILWTYLPTGEQFPKGDPFFRTGCYFNENITFSPEGDYRLDWHVIRNGVRTDSSRVFQVRAGQENLIEILY